VSIGWTNAAGAMAGACTGLALRVAAGEPCVATAEPRVEFHLLIGFAARAKPGFHSFRIVHSASGSKVTPVSLNRLSSGQYSPAELEWVESLARRLSD